MDDTTYITLLWRSKVQISQSADVKGAETLVGPFRVCRALFSLQGEEPTEETQEGWPGWPKETQLSALVGAQSGGRSAVSGALLWGGGTGAMGHRVLALKPRRVAVFAVQSARPPPHVLQGAACSPPPALPQCLLGVFPSLTLAPIS